MLDSSNLLPYGSSPTTSTSVQRPAMPTQFMMENAYTVAPMTSPQLPQYSTDNNFVYAQYTPQTPPTLPGSFKHYQEEYPQPRSTSSDTESVHTLYQREHGQAETDDHETGPQVKYEPRVASHRSPPPPAASKIIHRNVAKDKANEIEFSTDVDIMMKAIQIKGGGDDSGFGEAAYPSPPHVDEEKFNLRRKSCTPEEKTTTGNQPGRDRHKRYVCDVKGCNKRCSQKTQLETHKRAHTGEKPYGCPEPGCFSRFTQRGNLKTHIRSHTGERPYSCDLCGQTFAQRGNVKPHRLTHFKARPFPCKLDGLTTTPSTLTLRFSNLPSGAKLSEEDQKLFNHFAELYKNSNKGIKGRGKDRRDASKYKGSAATSRVSHHYPIQPPLVQHHIYPHSRFPTQHGLPCHEFGNHVMPRNGSQHTAYGMYDMDQASVTSSDTATASSSPVTVYEEEHGRTMLPTHPNFRMY
ncbi:hypothetical protein GGR53DRAFT_521269 [Hypoxylon sp. FL1150]|nr:hypothetical protein GGR53DRAFT_521269 [Hypoxylon sp. FL1150]